MFSDEVPYVEEEQEVVEITPEDIEHFNVPQYFQEIFDKYGLTEKGFDLKVILSSEENKAEFLEHIKKEIDEDNSMSRFSNLKIGDFFTTKYEICFNFNHFDSQSSNFERKAIKSSWTPISFTALWAAQAVQS